MAAKTKSTKEAQVLELLKSILPKTIPDPKLVEKVYSACELEIKSRNRVGSFEKFCEKCELPDLEPETVAGVKQQFEGSFGKGAVALLPNPEKEMLHVEVQLPDATFTGTVKVRPVGEVEEDQEVKLKFVSFPVALPADPELIWTLAKKENMTADEAAITLNKIQDDFWASKMGQKCLRDRVERTFAEFVARVPSKALTEVGLKRHYKEPEAVKVLRQLPADNGKKKSASAKEPVMA